MLKPCEPSIHALSRRSDALQFFVARHGELKVIHRARKGDVPVAQPGTDGQNPVLQTSLGTDLARQGAYRPLGRVFLAGEYPDLYQPC